MPSLTAPQRLEGLDVLRTLSFVSSVEIGVDSFFLANSAPRAPTVIRTAAVAKSAAHAGRNSLKPSRIASRTKIRAKKPRTAAIMMIASPLTFAETDSPTSCLASSISFRIRVERSSVTSFIRVPALLSVAEPLPLEQLVRRRPI